MKIWVLHIVYRNRDVSYNCNVPVSQSEYRILTLMRNSEYFIYLFVKIMAFWLMGKSWSLVPQRIEYQRPFSWQQHHKILFYFHFMNIDQILIKPLKILRWIFHILQRRYVKSIANFPSNSHNLLKYEINDTIIFFKPSAISKYRKSYNLSPELHNFPKPISTLP